MKALSIVALFAVMALLMTLGSSVSAFVDVPSLILIISISVLSVLARHGIAGLGTLYKPDENQETTYSLAYGALIGGVLAFPISAISVLSAADSMKHIGPAMAVTMLSPFYGMVIYACCFFLNPKLKVDATAALLMLPLCLISMITFVVITWLIKMG